MRNSEALENMIAAEQAKLDKLEEKQEDLSRKIKTCKANIEKYKLMKNNLQFNALSNALDEKGIGLDEIMSAISSGDLISLQKKLGDIEKEAVKDSGDT